MSKITVEEFENLVDRTLDEVRDTLVVKSREYSRNKDPLHNFRQGSKIVDRSMEDVLWNGYALKHLVSLQDLINEESTDIVMLDEKIGDLLLYLVLLKACFEERIL